MQILYGASPLHRLTQAYSQAPWRKQVQMIGAFLLFLVIVALIASMYLDVTARAAAIGREIQRLEFGDASYSVTHVDDPEDTDWSILELQQINADLETQLAWLTSDTVMKERAIDLGFEPVTPEQILYVEVPGYIPPQPVQIAPPPGAVMSQNPVTLRAEPVTLLEWLKEQYSEASKLLEEQP